MSITLSVIVCMRESCDLGKKMSILKIYTIV